MFPQDKKWCILKSFKSPLCYKILWSGEKKTEAVNICQELIYDDWKEVELMVKKRKSTRVTCHKRVYKTWTDTAICNVTSHLHILVTCASFTKSRLAVQFFKNCTWKVNVWPFSARFSSIISIAYFCIPPERDFTYVIRKCKCHIVVHALKYRCDISCRMDTFKSPQLFYFRLRFFCTIWKTVFIYVQSNENSNVLELMDVGCSTEN